MQVQCLHYCHETCRKEQVCAPSVQSQDLLVIRLARRHDFKIQKMLPHFRILKSRRLLLTLGERKSRTNQKRKKADETCKCEKTPEKFVKKSLLFILPHDFKKVESVQIKFLLKDLKFFHYYSNYKL